jgi:hypothetical protein
LGAGHCVKETILLCRDVEALIGISKKYLPLSDFSGNILEGIDVPSIDSLYIEHHGKET